MSSLPLAGRRVLVTRAAHQAGKLSQGLRALGANPIEIPVLQILPPVSFAPLDETLRRLDAYNWLILTSANTIRALTARAAALGVDLRQASDLKVAVVGKASAAAAQDAGFQITLVPELYVSESLLKGLLPHANRAKILLPQAAEAREVLPLELRAAGAVVDVVEAYRNVLPAETPELLLAALAEKMDAVTFASSSSAIHLAEAARLAGIAWPFAETPAISIGPVTSQTLRELGWPPAAQADPSDIPGLIAAVLRCLAAQ